MLCVADCVRDGIRFAIPQPTEWQRVGDQINTALIFAVGLRKRGSRATKSVAYETLPVHRSFARGNDTGPRRTGESICKNLPLQEVLGSAAGAGSQYR